MKVTLAQVAARCGLSKSAASKALNGYGDISFETQQHVKRVAQEMGYFGNALARGLKTHRTFNLGVLLMDENEDGLLHNFFSHVLNSFKHEAEKNGYDITFISRKVDQGEMSYLQHCLYRNIDGVFIAATDYSRSDIIELVSSDLPAVAFSHRFEGALSILSEDKLGMMELVRYIAGKGHEKIAFVHGSLSSVTEYRLQGYYSAMTELGLPIRTEYLVPSHYHNAATSEEAVRTLMALGDRPSCIIMPDDVCAIAAIRCLQDMGLSVPDDVSVAGYDGVPSLRYLYPLTTIKQDTTRIGAEAVHQLIRQIGGDTSQRGEVVLIPVQLLPGETVKQCAP